MQVENQVSSLGVAWSWVCIELSSSQSPAQGFCGLSTYVGYQGTLSFFFSFFLGGNLTSSVLFCDCGFNCDCDYNCHWSW